nr:hypothetical protein [Lachnospiraceae bacterium]
RDIFIDGAVVSCDVYPITAKEEDINKLLAEMGITGVSAQGDCLLEAALTPKGNLAYLGGGYAGFVFDMEIRSEECARNDMNISFGKTGGVMAEIICNGTENDNERHDDMEFKLSSGKKEISLKAVFDSTMSRDGILVEAPEINLDAGIINLTLSGDADIMFDADEAEEIPEPRREILKMSEADFDKLGVEIYDHLMQNSIIGMVLTQFGGNSAIGDLVDLMNSGR